MRRITAVILAVVAVALTGCCTGGKDIKDVNEKWKALFDTSRRATLEEINAFVALKDDAARKAWLDEGKAVMMPLDDDALDVARQMYEANKKLAEAYGDE